MAAKEPVRKRKRLGDSVHRSQNVCWKIRWISLVLSLFSVKKRNTYIDRLMGTPWTREWRLQFFVFFYSRKHVCRIQRTVKKSTTKDDDDDTHSHCADVFNVRGANGYISVVLLLPPYSTLVSLVWSCDTLIAVGAQYVRPQRLRVSSFQNETVPWN